MGGRGWSTRQGICTQIDESGWLWFHTAAMQGGGTLRKSVHNLYVLVIVSSSLVFKMSVLTHKSSLC